jgi:hypothetical protein
VALVSATSVRLTAPRPLADGVTHPASPGPSCIECGAPADVEAFRVDEGGFLVSDVAACGEHAGTYLVGATDVIHLDLRPMHAPLASGELTN